MRDVLTARLPNGERTYFNNNILNRFYGCDEMPEDARKVIAEKMVGNKNGIGNPGPRGKKLPPRTAEHKAKLSAASKGRVLSEETKAKISEHRKGKGMENKNALR